MLSLVQLEHQRRLAAREHQEQTDAVLRHTQISAINDMRRDLIAQGLDGLHPSRIQRPVRKLGYVFNEAELRPVKLQG